MTKIQLPWSSAEREIRSQKDHGDHAKRGTPLWELALWGRRQGHSSKCDSGWRKHCGGCLGSHFGSACPGSLSAKLMCGQNSKQAGVDLGGEPSRGRGSLVRRALGRKEFKAVEEEQGGQRSWSRVDKGSGPSGKGGWSLEAGTGEPVRQVLSAQVMPPDGFQGITCLPGKEWISGGNSRSQGCSLGTLGIQVRSALVLN